MTVECFVTSVRDLFPKLFRKPGRHEIFVLVICSSFFFIHLTLVTEVNKISPWKHIETTHNLFKTIFSYSNLVSSGSREGFTYSSLLIIMVVPELFIISWLYLSVWLWLGVLVSKKAFILYPIFMIWSDYLYLTICASNVFVFSNKSWDYIFVHIVPCHKIGQLETLLIWVFVII